MTTPALSKAEVGAELADLRRTVDRLVQETPEGRAEAAAEAEHRRLVALAEAGRADAVSAVAAFTPRLAAWRQRGEEALAQLPTRGNNLDAMAFERQMPAAEATCRGLVATWDRLLEDLADPAARTRLAAIASAIRTAQLAGQVLPQLRDGVRRLVADMRHAVTMTED